MRASYQKIHRSVTVLLVYCLFSVCISNLTPSVSVLAQTPQATAQVLEITGGKDILINGNKVPEGTTVPSGAEVRTDAARISSLRFDRLGTLEIGCRSVVKVAFNNDQIEITVLSGYARLVSNQGVIGTLILPDGSQLKTDSSLATSAVETLDKNPCAVLPPVVPGGAGNGGGLFGLGKLTTALLGGFIGVTAVALAYAARGPNCDQLPPQAVSNVKPCN